MYNCSGGACVDYEKGYATLWNAIHYAIYVLKRSYNTKYINDVIAVLEKALFENLDK